MRSSEAKGKPSCAASMTSTSSSFPAGRTPSPTTSCCIGWRRSRTCGGSSRTIGRTRPMRIGRSGFRSMSSAARGRPSSSPTASGTSLTMRWAQQGNVGRVAGAFLVAPSDRDRNDTPDGPIQGFGPMLLGPLPFPSMVVASRDDPRVSFDAREDICRRLGARLHGCRRGRPFRPEPRVLAAGARDARPVRRLAARRMSLEGRRPAALGARDAHPPVARAHYSSPCTGTSISPRLRKQRLRLGHAAAEAAVGLVRVAAVAGGVDEVAAAVRRRRDRRCRRPPRRRRSRRRRAPPTRGSCSRRPNSRRRRRCARNAAGGGA